MMAACKLLEQFGPLAGRLLLALIFILAGYSKLTGWGEGGTLGFMESKGIPFASIALGIAILIELGGGLLIALGVFARWAAFIIFLFLIPVTLIFHPFWADPGQYNSFMKNLAIMGGMLYIMTYGSGPYSLKQEKCE